MSSFISSHDEQIHCTNRGALAAESTILYLNCLSDNTAERMPDKQEMYLPFFRTSDVYEIYVRDFNVLYPGKAIMIYPYIMWVWQSDCSHIKVRKRTRFKKRSTCDRLRSASANESKQNTSRLEWKAQKNARKNAHGSFFARERR